MDRYNFLQLNSIKKAFLTHSKLIFLIIFLQILICFFSTIRYFSLLKIFSINVDFKNVTAATFVSNALGLWLPGSMAFIEIIRITLMLGAGHKFLTVEKKEETSNQKPISTKKSHQHPTDVPKKLSGVRIKEQLSFRTMLATVSLFDRLVGFWAMLLVGLFCLLYRFIFYSGIIKNNYEMIGLIFLFLFTFLSFLLITFLPYLSRKILIRKLFKHKKRFILKIFRRGFLHNLSKKIFSELSSVLDATAVGGKKLNCFLPPIFYSLICVFLQAISMYYSAIAIANFIPFSAILATISILALATLLPIGFGGIGGVQFIAAVSMSFFGISPNSAASAQFLQTALNLFSITFVGLFFIKLTLNQIKPVFQRQRKKF